MDTVLRACRFGNLSSKASPCTNPAMSNWIYCRVLDAALRTGSHDLSSGRWTPIERDRTFCEQTDSSSRASASHSGYPPMCSSCVTNLCKTGLSWRVVSRTSPSGISGLSDSRSCSPMKWTETSQARVTSLKQRSLRSENSAKVRAFDDGRTISSLDRPMEAVASARKEHVADSSVGARSQQETLQCALQHSLSFDPSSHSRAIASMICSGRSTNEGAMMIVRSKGIDGKPRVASAPLCCTLQTNISVAMSTTSFTVSH